MTKTDEEEMNFSVIDPQNDGILVGKAFSNSELPVYEKLLNFLNESYLENVMTENERKIFEDNIVAWINYHISFIKKADNIEGDLRDGYVFHSVLSSLNLSLTLPYAAPNLDEKKQNIYSILSFVLELDNKKRFDCDKVDKWSQQIYNGNTAAIMNAVILIAVNIVIQRTSDPIYGRIGIDQLEFWLRNDVGMSGVIDHEDIVSTDLEQFENLYKLAKYLNMDLSILKEWNSDEKIEYILNAIRKETGVPAMIQRDVNLRELEGQDFLWYYFLRYLWVAELYNSHIAKNASHVKGNSSGLRPKELILQAVKSSYELDQKIENLEQKCHLLFDWIQEKIECFKSEVAALDNHSCISTRNITLLSQFYKILEEEQTEYNKTKLTCYKLHCEIQRHLQGESKQHIEYHPTYNIYKVEENWNRLISLQRKLEHKIQEHLSYAENRNDLLQQWNREVLSIRQWMKRWQDYFVSIQDSISSLKSADLRKCMKTFKNRFLADVQEQNHVEQCRLLCALLDQFMESKDEKARILKETNFISEEFETFVNDVKDVAKDIKDQQEESTSLDVLYHEQADLLDKLDIQIHELYEYYSLRPVLTSLNSCDKLTSYINDTWSVLFEISHEMDAVLSLEKDIEEVKEGMDKPPRNHLTNLTAKHMSQRWDTLLLELKSLEDYIAKERVVATANDQTMHSFEYEIYKAAVFLSTEMLHITRSITEEGVAHAELLRKESDEVAAKSNLVKRKVDIETVKYHKTKVLKRDFYAAFEKIIENIEKSAENLPNEKFCEEAFEKILSLRECATQCFATIEIVLTDSEICDNYIFDKELSRSDLALYQQELDSCKKAAQLLPKLEDVTAVFYRKHSKERADRLSEELKKYVLQVDTLHSRVTLSAWLCFRRLDVYTELDNIAEDMSSCFHVLSGNRKFVTDRDLREHLEPSLVKFFKKRATEYFGDDYEGDEKAYDYRRLITNLVGKHRKLLVDPDPSR